MPENKRSQDQVDLRHAEHGDYDRCATCTSYKEDSNKCKDVEGEIKPNEICDIYTPIDPSRPVGSEKANKNEDDGS